MTRYKTDGGGFWVNSCFRQIAEWRHVVTKARVDPPRL